MRGPLHVTTLNGMPLKRLVIVSRDESSAVAKFKILAGCAPRVLHSEVVAVEFEPARVKA